MKVNDQDIERSIFSSEEAARACGVHRNTIARWCADGTIKAHLINGVWRIPKAELDRLGDTPKDAA